MIFRKSASAKLKKYYRQKLDANQTIDYNDMNVHVAALLLKVNLQQKKKKKKFLIFFFFSSRSI